MTEEPYKIEELPTLEYDKDELLREDSALGALARHADDYGQPLALWVAIGNYYYGDDWRDDDSASWTENFSTHSYHGYGSVEATRERLYERLDDIGVEEHIANQIIELMRAIPYDTIKQIENRYGARFFYDEKAGITYTVIDNTVYDGLVRL